MPRAIRYAVAGTVMAACLQLLVGVLLWTHRSEFLLAQIRLHPALSSAKVRDRTEGIVYGGLGTHLILLGAYLALAWGIARRRRGARLRLTVLLIAATIAGSFAVAILCRDVPTIRSGMTAVQAVSTVLRLGVVWLLWFPSASGDHFSLSPVVGTRRGELGA